MKKKTQQLQGMKNNKNTLKIVEAKIILTILYFGSIYKIPYTFVKVLDHSVLK